MSELNWQLITTPRFERAARRFLHQHPDSQPRLAHVLTLLRTDPFLAELRTHSLRGDLEGKHAASITWRHRIIVRIDWPSRSIFLLTLGTHDEVY